MSLDANGDIRYRRTLAIGGVRYQEAPPVCNACERPVTSANLGHTYLEAATPDGPAGQYHTILCRDCCQPPVLADQRTRERFALVFGA